MERHSAHNYHPLPVVVTDAEGAWVTDVDGRRYLDCLAGYSALNFGHRHPRAGRPRRRQLAGVALTAGRSATTGSARSAPPSPGCAARRWCCR